eukprot:1138443-Pelagomonas_calceolata.AAC.3
MPPGWNKFLGDLDESCLYSDPCVPLLSIQLSQLANLDVRLLNACLPDLNIKMQHFQTLLRILPQASQTKEGPEWMYGPLHHEFPADHTCSRRPPGLRKTSANVRSRRRYIARVAGTSSTVPIIKIISPSEKESKFYAQTQSLC